MDEIQRKLALIDRQLAGINLHKRIISTCPLVFVVTGLIAGILIQSILPESRLLWLWLILLTLCLLSAVLLFIIRSKGRLGDHAPVLLSYCALICFLCLGAIRLISFHQPEPNDIRNLAGDEPKLATIRGLIITEPYINKNQNWKFSRFKPGGPSSSFYLKITEVETTDGWTQVAGTVRVQINEPVPDLKDGDYIQIYCSLDRFSPPTNPGQFDMAKYMARKNVFIAAFVKSRDGIEILHSAQNNGWLGVFTKIKSRIRQSATRALLGNLSEGPDRGLLEALLLGYRGNIDSNTYRAFRKTGLLHFISLSGMHLGILIGMVWWMCKTAGLMKPARAVICIIAVAVFLLIVPPRAPTLRAAIICWVFCISILFRRHSNPINTLSLAAIILLLIRPTHLFEAGWQLSFGAVLAIVLLADRIHFFIYEKVTSLNWRKKKRKTKLFFHVISKPAPYLLRLFSMGLAAWLGGAGILLYHFYTITPLTSIWTLLVFPLVSLILILGFLKIILFFLLPALSAVPGFIVAILSNLLIWIVELIANLNISQILTGQVPLILIIFYYGMIIFAGFVYFRRRTIAKKVVCTVMFLALAVFLGAMKWQRTHTNDSVITCLDVGHGQAIFARLPGKANILFDAGSRNRSDIGRRVVVPFLDYNGINRIDAIFISHNDTDHINGIPEIVEHCKVGGVFITNDFFSKTDRWGTEKYLNDYFIENGLTIKPLDGELNLSSGADIEILWPSEEVSMNKDLGDNDKSLVSLIEFAGKKILICSDIEKFAQRELFRLHPDLKADIVFVPHHGSLSTLDDDFLQKLDPSILIYSCDKSQYERQSHMFKRNDSAESFYTSKHGTIAVCISADGLIKTTTFLP